MPEPAQAPPGIFGSLKRLVQSTLAIAQNRLELLLVELREERLQFFELLLLAGIVIVLAAMTLATATFAVVVLCLRAGRFDVLLGLLLLYLLSTLVAFWRLRQRLKSWEPLSATLAELKKDKACIEDKN